MVGVDLYRVPGSLRVDAPVLEPCHHCEKLLVVDRVVDFRWEELPPVVTDWMQVAFGRGLGQDGAEGVVGCVGLEGDWRLWLEVAEDGSRCEGPLQLSGRLACLLCPGELLDGLASQVSERGCQRRVTHYKLPI